MRLNKVDILKGKLTFGQKIDLLEVIVNEQSEAEKAKAIIRILGGRINKIRWWNVRRVLRYVKGVVDGLEYWAKAEAKALKYEPTAEEKKMGYSVLSKKFGIFNTVDALALKYMKDPDDILNWDYAKVFLILCKDLETHKVDVKNYERNSKKRP